MGRNGVAASSLVLVGQLLLSSPLLAEDLSRFQYHRDVTAIADGISQILLDAPVMGTARADLADLRLVNDAGTPVAFDLLVDKDQEVILERPAEIQPVERAEGEDFQTTICDLGESPGMHNRLVLETPAVDFRSRVEVATSQDQEEWIVARVGAVIYDVPPDTRLTAVDYPENGSRYLRIKVYDYQGRRFTLTGIHPQHRAFRAAQRMEVPGTVIERFDDTLKGLSRLTLDLGYERSVADRLLLDFGKRINFSSRVTIEGSQNLGEWHTVGSGALFAFDEPNLSVRLQLISFPEVRTRYLRLSIGHGGQEALGFGRIVVGSCRRILSFESIADAQYRLYYGNPSADTAAFRSIEAPTEGATIATLGPVMANPDWRDPETERRIGLYAGMAAVGLVALLALRFRRRTVRIVEEEEEAPIHRGGLG